MTQMHASDRLNRSRLYADLIPWDEYEERYASRFTSTLGNVAKPCRMALGALIIQKRLGFSDRELVEEIAEDPYFQYFIGLPGYQETAPFDASTLVSFRKRFNVDMSVFMNEKLLEKRKAKEESRKKQTEKTKETDQKKDDHHPSDGAGSSGSDTPNSSSEAPASEPPAEDSGEALTGEFPEGIKAYVQYGDSIPVLVGLLSTYGAVSTMRIHVLLGSLLGVSLSTGTISSMVSQCAQKVDGVLQTIMTMLVGADVANFDETGIRFSVRLFSPTML